ncbi:MAG: glycoside hydrolase family 127 protein, partial [Bacteroidota bacterium]|nr:glycoside hydrolase family 127 protein [Bacteroidota bacterium]
DLYKFTDVSDKKATIKVNGQAVDYAIENGYAVLNRTWKKGDMVEVNLPMEVRKVAANEKVKDDIGKIALQRGPLMYCAEWVDNNGKASNIIVPENTAFTIENRPDLLNGLTVIKSQVPEVIIGDKGQSINTVTKSFVAIPYYAWANRGKGEMEVWFPTKVKNVDLITVE